MKINGIHGANAQAVQTGMGQAADPYSKNIRNQIANAQKKLQDLSSNEELTPEEKMKKRQEIQQEITSLNQQLRQHEIEQRKERQSKGTSMDDMIAGSQRTKADRKGSGLSQAGMQAVISADSSMKLAQAQSGVIVEIKGRAGVLKSEIKADQGRGVSVEAKKAELAEAEQRAADTTASQINTLAEAGQAMKEAAKAEQSHTTERNHVKTDQETENSGTKADHKTKKSSLKTDHKTDQVTENNGQETTETAKD